MGGGIGAYKKILLLIEKKEEVTIKYFEDREQFLGLYL